MSSIRILHSSVYTILQYSLCNISGKINLKWSDIYAALSNLIKSYAYTIHKKYKKVIQKQ